jgi:hypothetical protein
MDDATVRLRTQRKLSVPLSTSIATLSAGKSGWVYPEKHRAVCTAKLLSIVGRESTTAFKVPMCHWLVPPLHTPHNVSRHTFFEGFFPNSLSVSLENRIGVSSTACEVRSSVYVNARRK